MYLGIKTHFIEEKYDFFMFGGIKAKVSTFEKRRDLYQFKKLSKHGDPQGLIVSNILALGTINPFELNTDRCDKIYKNWLSRINSLSYIFSEDIKKLDDDYKSNFTLPKDDLPKVIKLFLEKRISLETFTILLYQTKAIKYYDLKLKNDTLWKELSFKVRKYRPFLQYQPAKFNYLLKVRFNLEEQNA